MWEQGVWYQHIQDVSGRWESRLARVKAAQTSSRHPTQAGTVVLGLCPTSISDLTFRI